MTFNEDSRVKLPALMHLTRLGYTYLPLKSAKWDPDTNIFIGSFDAAILRLNPDIPSALLPGIKQELRLLLENEDLGRAFGERLLQGEGIRLIDFDNVDNNSFHVVTELPYVNGDDEFRPDVTLLVNGLPLAFIEVKKPNNRDGILAERSRIRTRCRNPRFRRFLNLTQLMVFSNNMEYDDADMEPLQGAFYATPSHDSPVFHYFREEAPLPDSVLPPLAPQAEALILSDNNHHALRHAPEYTANLAPDTPTNRFLTSLFRRERLAFLLRYGFAYVRKEEGYEKHIMRYPQLFATRAIDAALSRGVKKGIIWHTQGSGKTALAFYNVRFLTDRFQAKHVVPKFYFIVDRLDLLIQASREFSSRGLRVHAIQTREQFAADIKSNSAVHNTAGTLEITVVNIQKFQDEPDVVRAGDYQVRLQRVYFLDEVHRSYNPRGSFLANLLESDRDAILIGLTGTPLLGDDRNSRALFGDYLHKYYYNASIADGYTLRLIREEIATEFKRSLQQTLEEIKVLQSRENRETVYAGERFVRPMLDYILQDVESFRRTHNAPDIGAMVICDSAAQARKLMELFEARQPARGDSQPIPFPVVSAQEQKIAAEPAPGRLESLPRDFKVRRSALILHDEGGREDRKDDIEAFKQGRIDLLFVYNMLLTGFDAPRLKKLYLARLIRSHNLLQALTRVNRGYKSFRYGYVVDFANIEEEFRKTNQAYFEELQLELGDELKHYSNLFKTPAEILAECEAIQDALCPFDLANAETFSRQISQIHDRGPMLEIVRALDNARDLYNLIRQSGQYELLKALDFRQLTRLRTEAHNHLALINQKLALENHADTANILNLALEDILFVFRKVSEEELRIADELREALRRTRETLGGNFDPFDPVFRSLKEELERLFKQKNLSEISQEDMRANIGFLESLLLKAKELNRRNELIRAKYENDVKYARLHKRLMEKGELTVSERKLFDALGDLKREADQYIFQNARLLHNEAFARKEMSRIVFEQLQTHHGLLLTPAALAYINELILSEYLHEFKGEMPA